jgi:hypothetical protein
LPRTCSTISTDELHLVGLELLGQLDPEQQGPVLGDVVRRIPDGLAALGEGLTRGIGRDGCNSGGTRVATGAAIDVDHHLHGRAP